MKTKCEYSGTLFIISRKYFSVFRGPHLPLDTPFWTRCFPLVMQSRKAGFPFAARARKREPCLQRYVSRMTRTENFLSQFFSNIFWKPLLSTFYGTLFIISRKYFFGFSKSALRTYPSGTKGFRGMYETAKFPILRDKSRFFTFSATDREISHSPRQIAIFSVLREKSRIFL